MGKTYIIYGGQTVSGFVVSVGDSLLDYGTLSGGTIYGSAFVDSSGDTLLGKTVGATVESGGTLSLTFGNASATTILSGGQATADGDSVVNGGTISNGARLFVLNNSTASHLTVASGGALLIPTSYELAEPSGPGSATDIHVASGGLVVLGTGVVFTHATVDPGAIVASTGVVLETSAFNKVAQTISGFTIVAGSDEYVLNGGTAVHAIVDGASIDGHQPAEQVIETGGLARNTIVSNGLVNVEGTLQGATVFSGGVNLLSGSVATDPHISGGSFYAAGGADVTGAVFAGGSAFLDEGGDIVGAVIDGGYVENHGTLTSAFVNAGTLLDDGYALATTISTGGQLQIEGRSTASGTIVGSGGVVVLSTSVHDLANTTLLQGGTIDLARFAFVSAATATLSKRDLLTVSAGGKTEKLTLVGNYAGLQFVLGADPSKGTDITVSAASPAAGMAAEAVSAGTGAILQDMRTGSISTAGKAWIDQDFQVVGGGRSLSLPEHDGSNLLWPHLS